jgi:hypothetical protein
MAPPFFADGTEFIEPIACAKCGDSAYITRRAPHFDIPHAEIRTFQCPGCGHETERLATP